MINAVLSTLGKKVESSFKNANGSRAKPLGIGIDLGTTYSCVGVWQNGHIEIITNELGNRTTPSWVAFKGPQRLIGEAAKNQAGVNPTNTIFDVKRLIGRKFRDSQVQDDMRHWPFKVIENKGKPLIVVTYRNEEKNFSPEEISSMVLVKMKEIAETYLGKEVTDAVITVPAYFNNAQRNATKDAGVIAGLNVQRIINEPTAAAIAYGLDKKLTGYNVTTKNILVFDLGGGTFDVSLVAIKKGGFDVKAVSGNTRLGGSDFNMRLISHFAAELERKHKKKLDGNLRALGRLRAACERAKRILSTNMEAQIEIECLFDGIDFYSTITRSQFEKLNHDLFKECLVHVDKCLEDAKMRKTDVDDIVLVGGCTRIPKVQQLLQDHFHGKELCKSINPDEAVAYGAACHAASLAGIDNFKDVALVDVTPLSLGIEFHDKSLLFVVIPRNTPIPAKMFKQFCTGVDNLVSTGFLVYEGEIYLAEYNNFLGEFSLNDIPLGPKGSVKFDVCFEIDANGILTVSAVGANNEGQITITEHTRRLTKEEIDRMVKEAEKYKAYDEDFKRAVKAMTVLQNYIEEVKATVLQYREEISESDKRIVEDLIEQIIEWLDLNDLCGDSSMYEQKKNELGNVIDALLPKMRNNEDAKLGKTDVHDVVLVGGSSRIPKVQQLLQDDFGKELCKSINLDEVVAYGAVGHAASLAGIDNFKDVTPLSLGIRLPDKSLLVVIPRNTPIPTKLFKKLCTLEDNQVSVVFAVYVGERYMAKDNNFLGEFCLNDIPPKPKGSFEFDVCFEIDANGILIVSAKMIGTNNKKQITITKHNIRLTKDEIDRMVKEGEQYKAYDEEFKRAVKAKTFLQNYIEEVKATVLQYREEISERDKRTVEDTIEKKIEWLDLNDLCCDLSMIEQKKNELRNVIDDILRRMRNNGVTNSIYDVD